MKFQIRATAAKLEKLAKTQRERDAYETFKGEISKVWYDLGLPAPNNVCIDQDDPYVILKMSIIATPTIAEGNYSSSTLYSAKY